MAQGQHLLCFSCESALSHHPLPALLQVYWDASGCRERAAVTWASQSAAEQRSGRTGRTRPGTAYRLLPRANYLNLDKQVSLKGLEYF